jgi:hypothetical protein
LIAGLAMSAFEIFIDDDRYSVPTLKLITAETEAQARREAVSLLLASRHHLGVELCREGYRILGLGTLADGALAAGSQLGHSRFAE